MKGVCLESEGGVQIEDIEIVELYWNRCEHAIAETDKKYGTYCFVIARRILEDPEDARECTNDTWLDAWNAMPPHRPSILSTFLGKITRRISIDRWRHRNAYKRGGGVMILALEELEECVTGSDGLDTEMERQEMEQVMKRFLDSLPLTDRRIFLCRYWYLDSIADISRQYGFSQSKVTSMLHRTRGKLRRLLEKEGYL